MAKRTRKMAQTHNPPALDPVRRRGTRRVRRSDLLPFLFLILLSLILAVSAGLFLRKAWTEARIAARLLEENQLLRSKYDELMKQLIDLERAYAQLTEDYGILQVAFEKERREVARLRVKLEHYIIEVRRLEERIAYLKALLQHYRIELELLMKEYELLQIETREISDSLSLTRQRQVELEANKASLENKLKKAMELDISGISVLTYRERRRLHETDRARRVDVLEVCFLVRKNNMAYSGERSVYFQLFGPDETIVHPEGHISPPVNDEGLPYTFMTRFNYDTNDKHHCVLWSDIQELMPGEYRLKLFMDGVSHTPFHFELR